VTTILSWFFLDQDFGLIFLIDLIPCKIYAINQ